MNSLDHEARIQAMFEDMGLGSEEARASFKRLDLEVAQEPFPQPSITIIRVAAWTTSDLANKEHSDAELA